MAGSVNKVILVGNLGADPEIRHTQDGRAIANLRVATSENWRDKATGERREKTEWHRVVIFNENLAKIAEQYLKKGSKVYLEGSLQTRKWQDQTGPGALLDRGGAAEASTASSPCSTDDSATARARAKRATAAISDAPDRFPARALEAARAPPSTRSSTTRSRSSASTLPAADAPQICRNASGVKPALNAAPGRARRPDLYPRYGLCRRRVRASSRAC